MDTPPKPPNKIYIPRGEERYLTACCEECTPYYHIPDELVELGKRYLENGEYRDGDTFMADIMALLDEEG